MRLVIENGGFNVDQISLVPISDIPKLTVQAEDYDLGGQNVAYFDKTLGNTGGQYRDDDVDIWRYGSDTYYTGSNATGESFNYTIDVPSDGLYWLELMASTPNDSRQVKIEFDGVDKTGSMTIPNTGGWTDWQTLSTQVELNAGQQEMRLMIESGGFNVDWITLEHIKPEL
jgi:hypothetical protein